MRLIRCSGPGWAWIKSVKQATSAVLLQSALDIVVLAGQTTGYGSQQPILATLRSSVSACSALLDEHHDKGRDVTGRAVCDLSLLES